MNINIMSAWELVKYAKPETELELALYHALHDQLDRDYEGKLEALERVLSYHDLPYDEDDLDKELTKLNENVEELLEQVSNLEDQLNE